MFVTARRIALLIFVFPLRQQFEAYSRRYITPSLSTGTLTPPPPPPTKIDLLVLVLVLMLALASVKGVVSRFFAPARVVDTVCFSAREIKVLSRGPSALTSAV